MLGEFATSKAGHDKDRLYMIVGEEEEWVYLCDGRLRGVEHPKKKKKKHIQIIHSSAEDALIQSMQQNLPGEKDEINRRICKTLEAYLVVECQRSCHEGSTQQDDAEIALDIGLDGGGGTQENAQWCKEKLSKNGDEKSRQKAQHEARSCHLLRLLHLLGSQHS